MATATTHPTHYRAALVVARDVIEWGGQPWRVVSGRTCPRARAGA